MKSYDNGINVYQFSIFASFPFRFPCVAGKLPSAKLIFIKVKVYTS